MRVFFLWVFNILVTFSLTPLAGTQVRCHSWYWKHFLTSQKTRNQIYSSYFVHVLKVSQAQRLQVFNTGSYYASLTKSEFNSWTFYWKICSILWQDFFHFSIHPKLFWLLNYSCSILVLNKTEIVFLYVHHHFY